MTIDFSFTAPPPRRQCLGCRCRLSSLGNSSTASRSSAHGGTVSPNYSYAIGSQFFRARCTSFHIHSSYILPLCLSYFILAVPMRKCSGKHSCMSSTFPIAILNGPLFFRQAKLSLWPKLRLSKLNYNNNSFRAFSLETFSSFSPSKSSNTKGKTS